MRLAILSDATLPTPHPAGHGLGRMAHQVALGLHQRGHDVTLIAKRGSRFAGTLVEVDADNYQGEWKIAKTAYGIHQQRRFDAFVCNQHLHCLSQMFPDLPVINVFHDNYQQHAPNAILMSEGQRALLPPAFRYAQVIYNALPVEPYPVTFTPQAYALFMGAVAEIKQPILAIEACSRLGIELYITGMMVNGTQFPTTPNSKVKYLGAVTSPLKEHLLSNARVFLQLGYAESFGLTTLEAALCGTPVVAIPRGGSVDILQYGKNGVFVQPSGDMVQSVADAIHRAWWMDRHIVSETTRTWNDVNKQIDLYEQALIDVICGMRW